MQPSNCYWLLALRVFPVSAALFFDSLIPLAVENDSSVFLSALYGVRKGVPVLVFALLQVFGKQSFSAFFKWPQALKYGYAE